MLCLNKNYLTEVYKAKLKKKSFLVLWLLMTILKVVHCFVGIKMSISYLEFLKCANTRNTYYNVFYVTLLCAK